MTNVFGSPQKLATRKALFAFGVESLKKDGWTVSRVPRGGKASLREIVRGNEKYRVAIRTSQDAWIAFPRTSDGEGWVTLGDVDYVLAVSVDDKHDPKTVRAHMIPGDEARSRYDRAYAARKKAGHTIPNGRGIWLSLYEPEASYPVSHVGGGMGILFPAIQTLDLRTSSLPTNDEDEDDFETSGNDEELSGIAESTFRPLTILEAKRRLAATLGVPETAIKISIEH